jgi:hypothetical protein
MIESSENCTELIEQIQTKPNNQKQNLYTSAILPWCSILDTNWMQTSFEDPISAPRLLYTNKYLYDCSVYPAW